MKNHLTREIADKVLRAIFSTTEVRKLSKLRGVVLCGFPGCGKSTIAQLLQDAYGFEILSTDQIRTKELYTGQKHRMASEHQQVMLSRYMVYGELAKRINKKLNDKGKVVVDGTNLDEKRFSTLGAMLAKLPSNKMAMVVVKTPEWIIKKRFINWSKKRYDEWWSVYKYWKNYVKEGKAGFPKKKELTNVQIIKPKRYAIRTFDWVPEIKAIGWDLDGTLYPQEAIPKGLILKQMIRVVAIQNHWSYQRAKKEFFKVLEEQKSHTKSLDKLGVKGVKFFEDVWDSLNLEEYLKEDDRLIKMFRRLHRVDHFILSNSNRIDQIERKIRLLGLKPSMFKAIVSTVGLGAVKPDLKPFQKVLKIMDLKPEQILYVGDRIETDVIGANRAGMRSCLIKSISQEADVSLKTAYEVAGLFGVEI